MAEMLTGSVVRNIYEKLNSFTALRLMFDNYKHPKVSTDCQKALSDLKHGLNNGSLAAFDFIDANAKNPAGIMQGSFGLLGSFDQCLDSDYPNKDEPLFHGKYCSVTIDVGKKIAKMVTTEEDEMKLSLLHFDMCLPSSCTENDIVWAFNSSRQFPLSLMHGLGVRFPTPTCETRNPEPYTQAQINVMVVFGLWGVLLISGTLLDVTKRMQLYFHNNQRNSPEEKGSILRQLFLSFSMYTNGLNVFNTDVAAHDLGAIEGIRFLMTFWVILSHILVFFNISNIGNTIPMAQMLANGFFTQVMVNGTVSTDSFILISGLLVVYTTTQGWQRENRFNWQKFYLRRLWRLTPANVATIMFSQIFPLIGSGPTWKSNAVGLKEDCERNWFRSLFFFSNFSFPGDACISWGWFISMDMQLHVIVPLILLALFKKPIWGLLLNSVFLLASTAFLTYMGLVHSYTPTLLPLGFPLKMTAYMEDIYTLPYTRIGPYCIGIYVGYYLTQNKDLNLNRLTKTIGWCLAIACNVYILFGIRDWLQGHFESQAVATLYLATHRTVWACGVAWVILTCATGNGGIVNSFLTWKPFLLLGRLTYMAYLVHPYVILYYSGTLRARMIFTYFNILTLFLGFALITYGVAAFAFLAIDVPFQRMEIFMFWNRRKPISSTLSTRLLKRRE